MFDNDLLNAQQRHHDYFNNHASRPKKESDEVEMIFDELNNLPEEIRNSAKVDAKTTLAIIGGMFLLMIVIFATVVFVMQG